MDKIITTHLSKHHAVQGTGDELAPMLRAKHREWSDATFGDRSTIGPVGPLKHLAKEAQEAAENPGDISEYVNCMFLLWDAAHRAGFTTSQLIEAGFAKLDVLKARVYPAAVNGEPAEHDRSAEA